MGRDMEKRNAYLKSDKRKQVMKNYRDTHKEQIAEYAKEYNKKYFHKKKNDPIYKLKGAIRSSIKNSIKKQGYTKKSRTHEILGIDYKGFKEYIENQFQPWMTWENHGKYNGEWNYGWDLDHIKPISLAKTEEDIIKLNHYTNFQPLCSRVNRTIKKDNYYEFY